MARPGHARWWFVLQFGVVRHAGSPPSGGVELAQSVVDAAREVTSSTMFVPGRAAAAEAGESREPSRVFIAWTMASVDIVAKPEFRFRGAEYGSLSAPSFIGCHIRFEMIPPCSRRVLIRIRMVPSLEQPM